MFRVIKRVQHMANRIIKAISGVSISELSKSKYYVRPISFAYNMLPLHKSVLSVAKYNRNGDVYNHGKRTDKDKERQISALVRQGST